MSLMHRIAFAFEILLAELIFLFPFEKRKGFSIRLLLAAAATTAASCLIFFYIFPIFIFISEWICNWF